MSPGQPDAALETDYTDWWNGVLEAQDRAHIAGQATILAGPTRLVQSRRIVKHELIFWLADA